MKYIKLYEAFESEVITNTMKFLTKQVGKDSAYKFRESLKSLISFYDIPISELSEDDIDYFKKSKAINIKNEETIKNGYEVYCIKYWFSLEKGLLGTTGTGDLRTPYVKLKPDYSNRNDKFNSRQLEYIKNTLNIEKGKLIPVLDYSALKTGDSVVGVFGHSDTSTSELDLGKIYVDDNSLYAYQNVSSGSRPDNGRPSFASSFSNCWSLGGVTNPSSDHNRLHIWINDDKPLRYVKAKVKKEVYEPNSGDINKPLDGRYLDNWDIHNQTRIKTVIDDSDFAVIIYIDKLISKESKVSKTKEYRKDSRKGALALMSDDEIKRVKLVDYTNKIVAKYGLTQDIQDLSKLGRVLNNILFNRFVLYNLCTGNTFHKLRELIDNLYQLVNSDEDDKEYYFNRVLSSIKDSRKTTQSYLDDYRINIDMIRDNGDENLNKITDKLLKLGENVNKYIESIKIETIDDLIMIQHKLKSIDNFMEEGKYKLTYRYNDILFDFNAGERSMTNKIERCSEVTEEEFNDSMSKLNIIERYINSILK